MPLLKENCVIIRRHADSSRRRGRNSSHSFVHLCPANFCKQKSWFCNQTLAGLQNCDCRWQQQMSGLFKHVNFTQSLLLIEFMKFFNCSDKFQHLLMIQCSEHVFILVCLLTFFGAFGGFLDCFVCRAEMQVQAKLFCLKFGVHATSEQIAHLEQQNVTQNVFAIHTLWPTNDQQKQKGDQVLDSFECCKCPSIKKHELNVTPSAWPSEAKGFVRNFTKKLLHEVRMAGFTHNSLSWMHDHAKPQGTIFVSIHGNCSCTFVSRTDNCCYHPSTPICMSTRQTLHLLRPVVTLHL